MGIDCSGPSLGHCVLLGSRIPPHLQSFEFVSLNTNHNRNNILYLFCLRPLISGSSALIRMLPDLNSYIYIGLQRCIYIQHYSTVKHTRYEAQLSRFQSCRSFDHGICLDPPTGVLWWQQVSRFTASSVGRSGYLFVFGGALPGVDG